MLIADRGKSELEDKWVAAAATILHNHLKYNNFNYYPKQLIMKHNTYQHGRLQLSERT